MKSTAVQKPKSELAHIVCPLSKGIIPDLAYCDCSEEGRVVLFDEVGSSTGSAASGHTGDMV